MGQFKPMVKMMTTEPSVELKLKKGGVVKKAMGGDMMGDKMPSFSSMKGSLGAPRGGMDVAMAPKKPSMAKRKKAMASMPTAMKEGGKMDKSQDKAMIKKAFLQHDAQEHKGGKGTSLKLKHGGKMATGGETKKMPDKKGFFESVKDHVKEGAMQVADDIHYMTGTERGKNIEKSLNEKYPYRTKGMKTGGVSSGAGGYKDGGIIKSTSGQTKMVTAKNNGKSNYATGGVTSGAGGYKKGGKAMMDGGMVGGGMMGNPMMDDGMMRNRMMGGGYKKGGAPKKFAEGGSVQDDGRPQKMPQGDKPPSKPVSTNRQAGTFKKGGGVRKMQAGGGAETDYDPIIARENARMQAEKNAERADNEEMREMILGAPKRVFQGAKRMLGMGAVSDKEPKSVTKTEKSVTVSPVPKKRGGKVC
jgi:hypothetical protein